jgi:hypothetical protein
LLKIAAPFPEPALLRCRFSGLTCCQHRSEIMQPFLHPVNSTKFSFFSNFAALTCCLHFRAGSSLTGGELYMLFQPSTLRQFDAQF